MDLLHKLTIKNLKLNRKRTIVTIIGIILSVSLITAVASIFSSLLKSLINYTIVEKGDYHVVYRNVSTGDLGKFENNRNIEQINITQNIGYAKIDSKDNYMPYAYLKSFTKNSLNNLSVKLVDGRLPENDSEILIPTHLKTIGRLSLNTGDTITLNVGRRADGDGKILDQYSEYCPSEEAEADNEKIINTQTKTYKIVGIMERPASSIEPYSAPGYTFITYLDDQNLSGEVDLYTRYTKNGVKEWVKTTANILGVDLELFDKTIKEQKEENGEINVDNQTEETLYAITANSYLIKLETNPLEGDNVSLLYVIAIIIGIIMVASIFCIKNSFDISVTEKIKQYGMLRSIGATKKQIKRNVFYEATVLSVIAIPIGILIGVTAAYTLVAVCNWVKLLPELKFATSFVSIMASIILSFVTIYLSAFRSARKAAKASPIDSIRNSGDINIKPKKMKSSKIIGKVFGIGGEISFKNLKRNRKKYRTTVVSLVVSVFVFIALSSFMNIAFERVKNDLKIFDHNLSLSASIDDDDKGKLDKYLETTKLDNIEDYTVLRTAFLAGEGDKKYNPEYLKLTGQNKDDTDRDYVYFSVCALGKEQYKKYIKSLGLEYDKIKDKAIMMDYSKVSITSDGQGEPEYKTMRLHNYKTGEFLEGTISNKNDVSLEIGHITGVNPFGINNTLFSSYLVVSDELYDKIAPQGTAPLMIYYRSNNATQLQDDIDKVLGGEVYYVHNLEEECRQKEQLVMLVGIFLYGFITAVSLIGITSIFNTITTNMELRKQEFAMLKSVGMTTKEFNRMIRLETLFMGIKSLLFGLPIGIALSYAIYYYLAARTGLLYKLPIIAILISVIAVFVLISLIMRYSVKKIGKQSTIETISNENI